MRNVGRQLREQARLPAVNTRGRLVSGLVTMVMALAGFVTAGALPAAAAPGTIQYVALGDSYAAGTAHGCSGSGYPALLGSERILTANIACSGATTDEVIRNQVPTLKTYSDARLVTLTVGAANLGLSDVAAACLAGTSECGTAISNAQNKVRGCPVDEGTLGGDLINLYGEVAKAAPRARIVVTGYPLLFEQPTSADPKTAKIITAINDATTDLNCVIERAVAAANDADVNIHYVDVTEEFAERGLVIDGSVIKCPNPDAFIHGLFINCDPRKPDPEAFHPTAEGYRAYADAISAALPGGWLKDKS
jgi:lysophospholipase L1-like esterase